MHDWTQCVVSPSVNTEGFASLGVPVYRASTIPFDSAQSYANRHERGDDGYSYGLYGTPTTRTLERKITQLEQGTRTFLVASGQAAITLTMLILLERGDHVLIPDTVYPPVRDFANRDLRRLGIDVTFYDPQDLVALETLMGARTRLVWAESPGSTTMEVQDIACVTQIAHRHGALVGCDNTWATPLYFKPLAHGADIVVEALTKYFSGHSDVLMGSITVRDQDLAKQLGKGLGRFGIGVSPDDCSLVLRGIETMAVRLRHSADVASRLISRIAKHPAVRQVLYPAVPDSPGYELWRRDFKGASGVFSLVFTAAASPYVAQALDCFKTFAIGASWGGTRSIVAPMSVAAHRTASPWQGTDLILRVSVGLEAETDLLADLDAFLAHLDACSGATSGRPASHA